LLHNRKLGESGKQENIFAHCEISQLVGPTELRDLLSANRRLFSWSIVTAPR
jgi:hypothetical protein